MTLTRTGNRFTIARIAGGSQHNFLALEFEPRATPYFKITAHNCGSEPRGLTDESVTIAVRQAYEIAKREYVNTPAPTAIEFCDDDFPSTEVIECLAGIIFKHINEDQIPQDGQSIEATLRP